MPKIKMTEVRPGWVVRSERFAEGCILPDDHHLCLDCPEPLRKPAAVGRDPSRSTADFVAESVFNEEVEVDRGSGDFLMFRHVILRRLAADGRYDAGGEVLSACDALHPRHPVFELEVVGQMAHGGAVMTATLPIRS